MELSFAKADRIQIPLTKWRADCDSSDLGGTMADGVHRFPVGAVPQPRAEEERLAMLRLIRSRRVGPVTAHRLLGEEGSARGALAALPRVAAAAGIEQYSPCPAEVALAEMRAGLAAGARLVCHGEADYPAALHDLPDAPPVLWIAGDAALLQRPMVALVGARNASSLGVRMARRLAEGLSEAGYAVVSGLARGIDAAAHEAALAHGTIAVQAGGVDVLYPQENADLARRIGLQGCRISEQPMGVEPQSRHFPLRNRIVSGLAQAVVVVEAAARSGSLITARTALDQGREVMAVPGHPFDARATGCNILLRDGATLVRSVEDVLEAMGRPVTRSPAVREAVIATQVPDSPAPPPRRDIADVHGLILARLSASPLAEDQLIRDLAIAPALVAEELLTMELEGVVSRSPGGLVSRN